MKGFCKACLFGPEDNKHQNTTISVLSIHKLINFAAIQWWQSYKLNIVLRGTHLTIDNSKLAAKFSQ